MSGYLSKSLCSIGAEVTLSANFRGYGDRLPSTVGVRKLEFLGVVCVFLRDSGTHTHTHTVTHTHTYPRPHDDG